MKLLSINVGLPREVESRGKTVRTSIFKAPVSGRVRVTKLNVQGDEQSDLSVHGGEDKAVYAYPSEHYALWRNELPGMEFPFGAFGENLTTEGLLESTVHIGDRFRAGSCEFVVTQPRMPCFKLGVRFGRADMVKRFLHSGRTGFYLAVLREGNLAAGDSIDLLAEDENRISVADIVGLYTENGANEDLFRANRDLLRRASRLSALPDSWREYFRERLRAPDE